MFTHPATIIGFIVMAIGWVMLLSGGASDVSFGGNRFVNFHTLWIASALVLTGVALVISGVVAKGAIAVREALLFHPAIKAAAEELSSADAVRRKEERDYIIHGKKKAPAKVEAGEIDEAEQLRLAAQEKGFRM